MSQEVAFYLPDMLRNWPWPHSISAFYDEVKKESSEWCESFKAFSPKVQDVFNFSSYSSSSTDTDVANGTTARYQMNCVMDTLWDPSKPRPDDEWVGGALLVERNPHCNLHHTEVLYRIFRGLYGRAPSYLNLRRKTIGLVPSFLIIQIHLDIPDEVMENPALKELTTVIIDMLIVHNDLCSYNVEQARGDVDHNLITIFDQLTEKFWEAWDRIPTYNGPLDLQVRIYTDRLGNWVCGYDQWSFEVEISAPFLPAVMLIRILEQAILWQGWADIQRSRQIVLLPKQSAVEE
ncbi:terpenoid synthase [Mycena olivaceomarginata]|nr:terpenoid synthase [Mycena olivaceomarginata]